MNCQITALNDLHDVTTFNSGEVPVDSWLKSTARFRQTENLAQTFVIPNENNQVIGYYALCSAAIHRNELAKPLKKHSFPAMIPLILLARLGVDKDQQRNGIGARLLANAFSRCLSVSTNIAVHGVLVHALNERLKDFNRAYGFVDLPTLLNSVILPMKIIASAKP